MQNTHHLSIHQEKVTGHGSTEITVEICIRLFLPEMKDIILKACVLHDNLNIMLAYRVFHGDEMNETITTIYIVLRKLRKITHKSLKHKLTHYPTSKFLKTVMANP